jgi:hypothetical protein
MGYVLRGSLRRNCWCHVTCTLPELPTLLHLCVRVLCAAGRYIPVWQVKLHVKSTANVTAKSVPTLPGVCVCVFVWLRGAAVHQS